MDKVSDTPRTDAFISKFHGARVLSSGSRHRTDVELHDFARQLERELAEQKEQFRVLEDDLLVLGDERNAAVKDAERYRWLRLQSWFCSPLAVVTKPIEAIKLGYDCPSHGRLDALIDDSMREMK